MKNFKILMLASAFLLIAACRNTTPSEAVATPSEVVTTVIEASKKLDFETIKKHLANKRIARLESQEKQMNENPDYAADFIFMVKDAKIEIISETISEDGNFAIVAAKIYQVKGDDDKPFEKEFNLIKENGEWKYNSNPM
ncbi:MAG: DUF4878 domain-containing protein [Prevotellaceae bacterium]|jgi:ABC-type transporter MlaC component|nr:DUF4878 domain-containing protein [Prevotellaceae bacterium]